MPFKATLNTVSRLFPLFGSYWLASAKPKETEEQIRLLSKGVIYLTDVVVAESARLIGFTAGYSGVSEDVTRQCQREDWKGAAAEIAVRFLEQVVKDWDMVER